MSFASLCRWIFGKSYSRKERRRLAALSRKPVRPMLESLEERLTPTTVTQTAGGYTALTGLISSDTASNTNYVIQITNSFQFNSGGQVSISKLGAGSTLTIQGQNGTNYTLTGNGNRLFDITKDQTVSLENLTLTGGTVSGSAAKGGAVYNSGSLSMKSVVVAGNQAIGSSGDNGAGGGIYSSGGSLTLSHDVIGLKAEKTVKTNYNTKAFISKHTNLVIGASNEAVGGTGGSGVGGGLYVAASVGTVNISNCTIAGNQASGNVAAQGGGLYVNGTNLNLTKDLIGEQTVAKQLSIGPNGTLILTSSITGSANKAAGGSAMGGGLFVSGGTVSVSQGVIGGNQAAGGAGLSAAGGGVYSINASLTFKTAAFPGNQVLGGAGAAGVSGGNAQGGGLFISGGSASLTNCHLAHINALYASGGATGGSGGVGGNGGSVQGGGIYVDNATLTLTGGVLTGIITAGNGGNGTTGAWQGGAGGNAQGGVIFALNSKVTASGTTIDGSARPGNGGSGANGTSHHVTGGTGGSAGLGQGGGAYVQGGSLTLTNSAVVEGDVNKGQYLVGLYRGDFLGAQGGKGGAGYNVTSGAGGAGGQGNTDEGGGVFASDAAVTIEAGATVYFGGIHAGVGGEGGKGKTGGQGGNGGTGLGGGMFVQGGSVSLSGAGTGIELNSINDNNQYPNFPSPGNGGTGGTGGSGTLAGNGGKGGDAYGGGLYALGSSVTLNNGAILADNIAFSGEGGRGQNGLTGTPTSPGGNGGNGGAAGAAIGGGAYLGGTGVSLQINAGLTNPAPVEFFDNSAIGGYGGLGGQGGRGGQKLIAGIKNPTTGEAGGNGGNGGSGGIGEGGGLDVEASSNTTVNLNNAFIVDNSAKALQGGFGGVGGTGSFGSWAGGNGGSGGAAGSALGGGMYVHEGVLTLTNTMIEGNLSEGGIGGLGAAGGSAIGLTSKETKTAGHGGIAGNGGLGNVGGAAQGGGLYANGSTVTLNASTIDGNGSYGGKGGFGGYGGVTYIYRITAGHTHKTSSGNSGGNGGAGQGGGVFATGDSTLTALNSDISDNAAQGGAGGTGGRGGYYFYSAGIHYTGGNGGVGGNAGNGAVGQGGGAYVNGGALTLTNSTVANNKLWGGNGGAGGLGGNGSDGDDYGGSGGVGGNGGNAASASGGGVFATASALKLVNDTVANNTINVENGEIGGAGGVGGNGGNAGAALAKTYATVASRQGVGGNAGNGGSGAYGQGGGLYLGGGSLSLLNATFAYNSIAATTPGSPGTPGKGIIINGVNGPIQLSPNGQAGSKGTTTGTDQAGGLYLGSAVAAASVENTILALDTAATDNDVSATFSSSDDDFIGDGTGSNLSNGIHGDSVGQYSASQLTSFFGPLGTYGGTTETIMPIATSPTIGKGDPTAVTAIAAVEGVTSSNATDQRGLPRLANGLIDIGATEMQVDFTGTPSVTTVQAGQAGQTITYTVNVTNGEGVPINVTLTDVVPGGTTYVSNSAGGGVSYTSGAGWTITQPSATNSNTLTATTTLTPGETGTVTFTVAVAATASGTITDAANLSWTGTNTLGSLSVPMTTTVIGGVSSTTTTLSSSGNPSVYGQPVTFSATVSNGTNNPPTGNVVFEDGNTILDKVALNNGVATFTPSTLALGSHNITAIYCGDTNDYDSTSNTLTQVVDQDNTTTTLASSIIPSVYGQSVTFKAAVSVNSPGAGTPTGTVTFYDGSTKLGTSELAGGMATFTTSSLSVASHSITAVYGGDTNDKQDTSNVVTQVVDQDSTTTTVTSSPTTSVYGQPVTFTATVSVVSPGAGTPTGTVTFYDGSTQLGTGTLSNGVATLATSTLPGGNNSITAVYGGDANDLGSTTSAALSQVVNPASTTTSLASSLSTSPLGQSVIFTATVGVVSPGSGTLAGSVDFVDTTTGRDLGTVTLSPSGAASLSVSSLTLGSNVIEAIYSGQTGAYLGSTSSSLTETITQSILVLDSTDSSALTLSGNASIKVPGNVIVDSSSKSALSESGNASVKASSIQVVGGVSTSSNATLSPAAVTGIAAVANPLAYLTGPSASGLTNYAAVKYNTGSHTLNPGIYTSIHASGLASLTLNPGIYIIEGGGLTVTGDASIAGSGVMIYNTSSNYPSSTGSYGGITLSGNGAFSVTAPTSGPYAGIVIFQPSANTRAISLSGNAAAGLSGTIYAPAALLYVSGNASINGALVVKGLSLSGNAASTQTAAGANADNAGSTAGQLLAGDVEVYVNNSNGDLTADELARIQDAVNAVNAVVSPYGVAVAEVSDPTQANVTLSMGTTSAAGNYGQGVLGCYTLSGQITLIQGWNWYAGADPSQIGANQYDFETTVTHELGHALGLGHSSLATSAMYATLTPATAIRTLTTADLNIPYAEAGADAQMAALPTASPIPAPIAGASATGAQGTTPPSSTSSPSSGSPMSAADQLFADLGLLLNDLRNAYQSQLSSLSALWQQMDALALQRFDATQSLEASAIGMVNDALLYALLLA